MSDYRTTGRGPEDDAEKFAVVTQAHSWTFRLNDLTDRSGGGSCVATKIGGRFFFATAAHVVKEKHTFEIVLREPACHVIKGFSAIHRDVDSDVALLEINKSEASRLDGTFLPEDQIAPRIDCGQTYPVLVIGYPGQFLAPIHRTDCGDGYAVETRNCMALTYDSVTLRVSECPSSSRTGAEVKDSDLYVAFEPGRTPVKGLVRRDGGLERDDIELDLPALQGVSGGGIWLQQGAIKGQIWRPYATLVAIQVAYEPTAKWIRGIRIAQWLHLVARHYPDLRTGIGQLRSRGLAE